MRTCARVCVACMQMSLETFMSVVAVAYFAPFGNVARCLRFGAVPMFFCFCLYVCLCVFLCVCVRLHVYDQLCLRVCLFVYSSSFKSGRKLSRAFNLLNYFLSQKVTSAPSCCCCCHAGVVAPVVRSLAPRTLTTTTCVWRLESYLYTGC